MPQWSHYRRLTDAGEETLVSLHRTANERVPGAAPPGGIPCGKATRRESTLARKRGLISPMLRLPALAFALVSCVLPSTSQDRAATAPPFSVEEIMAHPDWIGRPPQDAYWADDSRSVYYEQKRLGAKELDLVQLDLATGVARVVPDAERGSADAPGGDFDRSRARKVYAREGDLFVEELASGRVLQLTRTLEDESNPAFLLDGERIRYERNGKLFARELSSGLEEELARILFEDDPLEKDRDEDYLAEQQERLLSTVREERARREHAERRERERQAADPTRAPLPWYLGAKKTSAGLDLSPDGRWLCVRVTAESETKEKRDALPKYVTETSFVETEDVRAHVGKAVHAPVELVLLDLATRERKTLDLSVLPGVADQPLQWLVDAKRARDAARKARNEQEDADRAAAEKAVHREADDRKGSEGREIESPARDAAVHDTAQLDGAESDGESDAPSEPRGLSIGDVHWAPDASTVVFSAFSFDNKDRWIARVDLDTKEVLPIHHLRDEAWIGWDFNELGWLADSSGVWFTSEESGFSRLNVWSAFSGAVRTVEAPAFRNPRYEVDSVASSASGDALWFRANADDPSVHELYRFALPDGPVERVTSLGGETEGVLSPDGTQLLLTHSRASAPPELYLQDARPGAEARRVTSTTSEAFRSRAWVEPLLVDVPSRHGGTIRARLYLPPEPAAGPRPAVAFVHGAGYLQNAHAGWSYYFREFMFHSLLASRGFVVIDADYRASAGYGRDWRTAIYRRMGTPELEDYEDCVDWLVEHHAVDRERVGVYGVSYGGFLALMALFTKPDLFACGAALRPVTDWAHYNDPYTSNILNTPELDPEAYERSSPIEFAAGLTKPLLICHGLVDDNVLAKDSIRLAQRLIELEKQDWELALYPVEAHAFTEPSSWLDEYRRILALFERWLELAPPAE